MELDLLGAIISPGQSETKTPHGSDMTSDWLVCIPWNGITVVLHLYLSTRDAAGVDPSVNLC